MKKLAPVILIFVALLLFVSCTEDKEDTPAEPVATVNGEAISSAELEYFKSGLRSQIIAEYSEKYGVTDFREFWSTEYDGKTPEADLKERALAKCVRAKIELVMCREKGIYDDISYEGLRAKAERFNAANANKSGVVGLKSISLDSFYTYYISNGVLELQNILEADELKPTDEEISREISAMSNELKTDLSEEEIRNSAADNVVNQKYEKMVEEKIEAAKVTS